MWGEMAPVGWRWRLSWRVRGRHQEKQAPKFTYCDVVISRTGGSGPDAKLESEIPVEWEEEEVLAMFKCCSSSTNGEPSANARADKCMFECMWCSHPETYLCPHRTPPPRPWRGTQPHLSEQAPSHQTQFYRNTKRTSPLSIFCPQALVLQLLRPLLACSIL